MRAQLIIALALAVTYCDRAPRGEPARQEVASQETAAVQPMSPPRNEDSLARVRWTESARYRQLLLAAREAEDKRTAIEQTTCESQRLYRKLGESEASRAMSETHYVLLKTREDSIADQKIDFALRGQEIKMLKEAACDSIAKSWTALDTLKDDFPGRIMSPTRY